MCENAELLFREKNFAYFYKLYTHSKCRESSCGKNWVVWLIGLVIFEESRST